MLVYRHIRLDTGFPFYIGIGKNKKRPYEKHKRTKRWKNIVNKCGYKVEILLDDLTKEEACKKEIEFIKLYGRECLNNGILCNIASGGEMLLGLDNPMYDRGIAIVIDGIEYSSIITASRKLNLHLKTITYRLKSPYFQNYIKKGECKPFVEKTNGMKGRTHTIKTKMKLSEKNKGRIYTVKNRFDSILCRKNRVPVILFSELYEQSFISISLAAKFLGVNSSSIKKALRKNSLCKGFKVGIEPNLIAMLKTLKS